MTQATRFTLFALYALITLAGLVLVSRDHGRAMAMCQETRTLSTCIHTLR